MTRNSRTDARFTRVTSGRSCEQSPPFIDGSQRASSTACAKSNRCRTCQGHSAAPPTALRRSEYAPRAAGRLDSHHAWYLKVSTWTSGTCHVQQAAGATEATQQSAITGGGDFGGSADGGSGNNSGNNSGNDSGSKRGSNRGGGGSSAGSWIHGVRRYTGLVTAAVVQEHQE